MSTSFAQTILARARLHEVMNRWPVVCQYLTDRQMACVGCPMAQFESVSRVEEVYRLPRGELVRGLLEQRRGAYVRHTMEGTDK